MTNKPRQLSSTKHKAPLNVVDVSSATLPAWYCRNIHKTNCAAGFTAYHSASIRGCSGCGTGTDKCGATTDFSIPAGRIIYQLNENVTVNDQGEAIADTTLLAAGRAQTVGAGDILRDKLQLVNPACILGKMPNFLNPAQAPAPKRNKAKKVGVKAKAKSVLQKRKSVTPEDDDEDEEMDGQTPQDKASFRLSSPENDGRKSHPSKRLKLDTSLKREPSFITDNTKNKVILKYDFDQQQKKTSQFNSVKN